MNKVRRLQRLEEVTARLPEQHSSEELLLELAYLLTKLIEDEFNRTFGHSPSEEQAKNALAFIVENIDENVNESGMGRIVAEAVAFAV